MSQLPPLPIGVPPGHSYWNDWYEKLRYLINQTLINHNDTQNIQGGSVSERYHLTNAQYLVATSSTSGVFTPTLTNTTNISSSTANECHYLRVNNEVFVSGTVAITPTAGASSTILTMTIPVTSTFSDTLQCSGTAVRGSSSVNNISAVILGDAGASTIRLVYYNDADTTDRTWRFTYGYRII